MGQHAEHEDPGLRDTVRRDHPVRGAPEGEPSGALRPGLLIGDRYRLVTPIGRGGMAEVWRARHEGLRTDVAIKFLSPELVRDVELAPLALARFRFEAQVSARLGGKTRHSVSVYDVGTHHETPYLVMELVTGRDLERVVAESGPLAPRRFGAILDQVADALDVAHGMGIVHRDLKPSNLLLAEQADGSAIVKVADFGVAKATRADSGLDAPRATASGILVGSPAYMSPEQIDGHSGLQGSSDVWALGVVAYEVLTGKPCFDGDSLTKVLVSVASRRYVPMSQIRPELGPALDAWLDRCLSLEPSERFPTVAEMSRAFHRALPEGRSEQAPAVHAPAPTRSRALRLAAIVTLAVAAVAVVAFRLRSEAGPAETAPAGVSATSATPPSPADTPAPNAAVVPGAEPSPPASGASAAVPGPTVAPRSPPSPSAAGNKGSHAPGATAKPAEPTAHAPAMTPGPASSPASAPSTAAPAAPSHTTTKTIPPSEIH